MAIHSKSLGKNVAKNAQNLISAGELQAAKTLLAGHCSKYRRDADAWMLLGLVSIQLGAWEDAKASYQQVLRIVPDSAPGYFGLGNALLGAERCREAIDAYRQALELKPDFGEAMNNLGRAYQLTNDPETAITFFARALILNPNLAKTSYNLGLSFLASGKPVEAVRSFYRASQLSPDQPEVLAALGHGYADIGQLDLAIECLEKVARATPHSETALCDLGAVNKLAGRADAALEWYRRALAVRPDSLDALAGEVATLDMLGEVEEAYWIVRKALDAGCRNSRLLIAFSNVCRYGNSCEEAILLMEEGLKQADCQGRQRTALLFCLGRLYDARKDYDRAFATYADANRSVKIFYDPSQHRRYVDSIIQVFGSEPAVEIAEDRSGVNPIFIVGMPRSGTTLVEQILAGHPLVSAAGELPWIPDAAASLPQRVGSEKGFPHCLAAVQPHHLKMIAEHYRSKISALAGNSRFVTDKMPTNFLYLGLIRKIFPGAPIIHCMRDPMDTCLSNYFQNFDLRIPYSYNLSHIGQYYREYVRLMQHWQTVLDPGVITVQYSELVEEPEQTVRALLAAAGLSWEPECLKFAERKNIVATVSYDQVRRPIYKSSLARWRHYEKYLDELKSALEGVGAGTDS